MADALTAEWLCRGSGLTADVADTRLWLLGSEPQPAVLPWSACSAVSGTAARSPLSCAVPAAWSHCASPARGSSRWTVGAAPASSASALRDAACIGSPATGAWLLTADGTAHAHPQAMSNMLQSSFRSPRKLLDDMDTKVGPLWDPPGAGCGAIQTCRFRIPECQQRQVQAVHVAWTRAPGILRCQIGQTEMVQSWSQILLLLTSAQNKDCKGRHS